MAMDPRVLRTKRDYHNAMIELLETVPLEKMTVKQLCETSGISRTTFYEHYAIPQDCFHELVGEYIDELRSRLASLPEKDMHHCMLEYLKLMQEHRSVFRELHRTSVNNPVFKDIAGILLQYIVLPILGDDLSEVEFEKTLRYNFYGFLGLTSEWLEGGCIETPEEQVHVLDTMMELLIS